MISTTKPCLPQQFHQFLLQEYWGQIFSSDEDLAYWNGSHLQTIGDEELKSVAALWLARHHPKHATHQNANQCFREVQTQFQQHTRKPCMDSRRAIIPCRGGYLEIDKEGAVRAIEAVLELGVSSVLAHSLPLQPGESFQFVPFSPTSAFQKFLNETLPDSGQQIQLQKQCGNLLLAGKGMRVHWAGDDEARETMIRIAAELQSRVQSIRGVELEKSSSLKTLLGASWVIVEGQGKREKLVHLSPEMKYLWTYPTSLALAGSTLDWKISTTERGIDFPKEVWQEERAAIFSWMVEGAQLFFLGAAIDKN